MAAKCLAAIHVCRIRVTRLDAVGNPAPGPNNVYVSDKTIQVNVTPVIEAGDDKTLKGGCNCILAAFQGPDLLKRFDLELDLGKIEPGLLEMLTGATAISSGGVPIGQWWPDLAFDCAASPPLVAFEAWQDAIDDDHPDPTYPYLHWIWPATLWQIDQHTLGAEFTQPKLKGKSRGNPQWGTGIFGDQPEAAQPLGGGFYTNSLPAAACGYLSHAIT